MADFLNFSGLLHSYLDASIQAAPVLAGRDINFLSRVATTLLPRMSGAIHVVHDP